MKKHFVLICFVAVQIGNTFGQSTKEIKLYSVKELQNDIDSLTKYIEETHPNAFYKFSKDKFFKEADSIKAIISKPLNSIDFYILTESLIANLEDGHTAMGFPMEYIKMDPFMFPYKVKLSDKEPFIIIIKPFQSMPSEITSDAEIMSINGVESSNIIKDIIKLNSGESENIRLDIGANYFFFYLNKLYGMNDSYLIKYKINNKVEMKSINGIKYESLIKRIKQDTTKESTLKQADYSLKLVSEKKIAIIDFKSFDDVKKFSAFIDSAFDQIKINKIENLIIDIRNNRGGNSQIGDIFFQYISHLPYTQYAKDKIKYSSLQKESYKMKFSMTQDSSWLYYTNKPNGLIEEENDTSTIKLQDNPLRFNGNVYLLTGISTFSSAASFAQCFKYYKMGKIIGEETGGWIIHYGDVINATLPNTRLNLTISHKIWYEIGAKENDFHGTIPDIKVPSEKALDYTIELINKK